MELIKNPFVVATLCQLVFVVLMLGDGSPEYLDADGLSCGGITPALFFARDPAGVPDIHGGVCVSKCFSRNDELNGEKIGWPRTKLVKVRTSNGATVKEKRREYTATPVYSSTNYKGICIPESPKLSASLEKSSLKYFNTNLPNASFQFTFSSTVGSYIGGSFLCSLLVLFIQTVPLIAVQTVFGFLPFLYILQAFILPAARFSPIQNMMVHTVAFLILSCLCVVHMMRLIKDFYRFTAGIKFIKGALTCQMAHSPRVFIMPFIGGVLELIYCCTLLLISSSETFGGFQKLLAFLCGLYLVQFCNTVTLFVTSRFLLSTYLHPGTKPSLRDSLKSGIMYGLTEATLFRLVLMTCKIILGLLILLARAVPFLSLALSVVSPLAIFDYANFYPTIARLQANRKGFFESLSSREKDPFRAVIPTINLLSLAPACFLVIVFPSLRRGPISSGSWLFTLISLFCAFLGSRMVSDFVAQLVATSMFVVSSVKEHPPNSHLFELFLIMQHHKNERQLNTLLLESQSDPMEANSEVKPKEEVDGSTCS